MPLTGAPPSAGASGQGVAILLPLSGPRAEIGQTMLRAAQLALDMPGAPSLDAKDTGGTPSGAVAAAQAAIAAGAGLILGPLTSPETAAVAPIARAANVAVLAFTNDPSQAQPGVWTLGITPGQQVRRLVAATEGQGKSEFAGLLPDNDFGHAMGQALTQATAASNSAPPNVRFYAPGMPSINTAARNLSGYANRRGPVDAQIREARALGTPEGRHQAQELAKTAIPPPSFNTLLLADTGDALAEIAAVLPYYDVDRSAVQIIGPALWASPSSGSGQFRGAWYAAPDPATRSGFAQAYSAKYGSDPGPLADLAYDAASIARVLGGRGFSIGGLTQPAGFVGADGWFALLADGQVRRALAVFAVERGGPQMVEPAPTSANVPGA
jgi:ABC-type branched-subunit amino acid transport system substrate-binding protein